MEGSLFGKRRFQSLDYSFHSSFELSNNHRKKNSKDRLRGEVECWLLIEGCVLIHDRPGLKALERWRCKSRWHSLSKKFCIKSCRHCGGWWILVAFPFQLWKGFLRELYHNSTLTSLTGVLGLLWVIVLGG